MGIGVVMLSVVVMSALALWERHTRRQLGSASVVADSHQTMLCAGLSVAVLVGLVARDHPGLVYADTMAALVIAAFAIREGREAWGGACGSAAGVALGRRPSVVACGPVHPHRLSSGRVAGHERDSIRQCNG